MSAHLADTSVPMRDVFYSTTESGYGQSAMVTDGKWKYICSEANATEELYDQINDPGEIHNLANNPGHEDKKVGMQSLLRQCAVELKDTHSLIEMVLPERMWTEQSDPKHQWVGWVGDGIKICF